MPPLSVQALVVAGVVARHVPAHEHRVEGLVIQGQPGGRWGRGQEVLGRVVAAMGLQK